MTNASNSQLDKQKHEQLMRDKNMLNQRMLKELQVEKLPSLPHVLVELLDACQSQGANFQHISKIVGQDAAICARVISLANSPFYKRGAEIQSIERALLVLGTDTVKTIVITASIQQFFSSFKGTELEFLKRFWRQSLACAHLCKALALLTSYPKPEEAYLAGILHNIGELVLCVSFHDQYLSLIQSKDLDSKPSAVLQEETKTFGLNHADIGALLIKEWHLSDLISQAIEFHHAAANEVTDAHHLVKLVYLASHLSEQFSASQQSDEQLKHDLAQLNIGHQLFELNSGLLFEIASKVQSDINEVASSLDIEIGDNEQDQSVQVKLAKYVRSIGLVQTVNTHINQAQSLDALNKAFSTSIELLFGYSHSVLFWYQPKNNSLSYSTEPDNELETTYTLKLEAKGSIVSQSGLDNKIYCSMTNFTSHSVLDEQLCRKLNASGLLCVPIYAQDTLFGVIVLGCDEAIDVDSNLYRLLNYFANEVSKVCHQTLQAIQSGNQADSQSMQQRAHEIAHEANNPLNIINNYLISLSQKVEQNEHSTSINLEEVAEELEILREEVGRTSEIISRLKDLKKEASHIQGQLDINSEIRDLHTLYQHSLFLVSAIDCHLDLDPQLTTIRGNKNQFKQIITNLVKNAVEALPQNGKIQISSAANIKMNGQDFVEIVVSDNGPGIPQPILENLFTPVNSTKGGKHSGLGLSITKNLVTDAKGTISCKSNIKGTSFQILLPQHAIQNMDESLDSSMDFDKRTS